MAYVSCRMALTLGDWLALRIEKWLGAENGGCADL
jgi:hypothetical protein